MKTLLTRRENEISGLVAWGQSADEIAHRLSISPNTVRNTLRNVYAKLGLNKANELAAYVFCTRYGVDVSKDIVGNIKRAVGALSLMMLFFSTLPSLDDDMRRPRRGRRRTEQEQTV